MIINDNIAAISTAQGAAGVAVIRISGNSPLSIAEKIFTPSGKTAVKDFIPNMMYTGELSADSFSDFCMCVYFKAPKSFTGEDTVEFHTHGGIAITRGILRKILSSGARLAERGEFTKRAFLNGKLSLSSCEGLIDMINSEWESSVKAGYSLYREKLSAKVLSFQDKLLDALSSIDANIDFPEEGLEETSYASVKADLEEVVSSLNSLISTYSTGRAVKTGVKVCLVGKPNTGKSSLLNALLSYDKAIVSVTPGTTRDVVEGAIDYNGVRFNFSDTAGIREAKDDIESIGVNLSKKILSESDLTVFLVSGKPDKEDKEILSLLDGKNYITVFNKTDIIPESEYVPADAYISAKTGENIDKLKDLIYEKTVGSGIDFSGDMIMEERHYFALLSARDYLKSALDSLDAVSLDILSVDIKNGWTKLGEITGKTASEEIIDNIFSKFCVGK